MPFDRTGRVNTSSGIAVGIKRGATGRIILIGGHIDSAGPEIPGADDDGSGAATVLELARLFGHKPSHSTLVFCCVGGEEQRLDGGPPGRSHGRFSLYLLFRAPLIGPLWVLPTFAACSLLLSAIALVAMRRRRETPDPAQRIRWPGVKLLLAALIIASCGWLSPDALAILRGIRHPWLTSIPLYYLFALVAMAIGSWLSIRLMRRLKLPRCPYQFFKRAVIGLAILLLVPILFAVKLTVEPAVALFLVSL